MVISDFLEKLHQKYGTSPIAGLSNKMMYRPSGPVVRLTPNMVSYVRSELQGHHLIFAASLF